jgi:hypothetical protein
MGTTTTNNEDSRCKVRLPFLYFFRLLTQCGSEGGGLNTSPPFSKRRDMAGQRGGFNTLSILFTKGGWLRGDEGQLVQRCARYVFFSSFLSLM